MTLFSSRRLPISLFLCTVSSVLCRLATLTIFLSYTSKIHTRNAVQCSAMAETTTMLAVASVFSALATTFVVLRMVSRMKILRKASIDDYLIVLAVVFSWFQTGSIYARKYDSDIFVRSLLKIFPEAQFGSGKHIQQIRLQDYSNLLLVSHVSLGRQIYRLIHAIRLFG